MRRLKGEGTIFRRKDGRWCGAYYDTSNQPKRHFVYGTSRREVQAKLEQKRTQDALGEKKDFLLQDWVLEYLQNYKKNEIKETTYSTYLFFWRRNLQGTQLGQILLSKLNTRDLQAYYNQMQAQGYSSKTLHHLKVLLGSALKQAVREHFIGENPNEYTILPRKKAYTPNIPSKEEILELVQKAKADPLYPIIITTAFTGMRKGEVMGLRWENVDFEERTIHVRQSMCRVLEGPDENGKYHSAYKLLEPKTRKSIRDIPMAEAVYEALQLQQKYQETEKNEYKDIYIDRGLVFAAYDGGFISQRGFMDEYHLFLKRYGVTNCRFHDLRHFFASLMLDSGASMKVISELLGHSQISISMDLYTHVYDSVKKRAVDNLNKIIPV